MTTLVEQAIQSHEQEEAQKRLAAHERAKVRAKECFGDYAESDLVETGKPCHFRIKGTNWLIAHGFCDGFTLWHVDRKGGDVNDTRWCAWQIVDMASLGNALKAVFKRHGK